MSVLVLEQNCKCYFTDRVLTVKLSRKPGYCTDSHTVTVLGSVKLPQ